MEVAEGVDVSIGVAVPAGELADGVGVKLLTEVGVTIMVVLI